MATLKHFIRPLHLVLLAAMLLGTAAFSGCTQKKEEHSERESMLTESIQAAPPRVREAYQYAVDHPDLLANQPCYCGCGAMGHGSNLNCYIRKRDEKGNIDFDSHALGCGICVDITQDVMRLTQQGMSQGDIRTYIDNKYSPFGPSTDTPLPEV